MQSLVRTNATAVSNPLFGNRLSYRVVAAPAQPCTATRQVVTMAKKKGVRIIVTMECTEARTEGATPSRYTTQKVCSGAARVRRSARASLGWPIRAIGCWDWQCMGICMYIWRGCRCSGASCVAEQAGEAAAASWHSAHAVARLAHALHRSPHHISRSCNLTSLTPGGRTQNRRNHPERLELKKYNPHLRRYTLHREIK